MTETEYGIAPSGHRLPAETRLGRVRLQIADLEKSLAYYQDVLGMRVIERSQGRASLGPHGADNILVELHERPDATPIPRRGRIGLYHFALLLPDRPSLGRFLQHLHTIDAYAGMSDHFVSEALYLTDPDGLGIEIYADRPRNEWRTRDRQLVMSTEPLDVASVIDAAGGEKWEGMPAGTVLGHVHLFVQNLETAASFYHDALGFDKVVWSYPGALFLSAGGYHHHLGTNTWAAEAPVASESDARLLEWEIVLPTPQETTAALDSFDAAGFKTDRDNTGGTARDPWGTTVRILSAG